MDAIKYKICDGASFGGECYGKFVYMLDFYNDKGSACVVFDTKNQVIYEVSACDYKKNAAYKWTNPKFLAKRNKEMKSRGFKEDQAWDEVNYQPVNTDKIIKFVKMVANRK